MSNAQIAQKIKDRCKEKNVSVTKLLLECNIRKSLIYDLEKRDYTPSVTIVEQIANYLDCSVDYLLGRTNDPRENVTIESNSHDAPEIDKFTAEFMKRFEKLDFDDKLEIMNLTTQKLKKSA